MPTVERSAHAEHSTAAVAGPVATLAEAILRLTRPRALRKPHRFRKPKHGIPLLCAIWIAIGAILTVAGTEAQPQITGIKALPGRQAGSNVRAGDPVTLMLSAPLPAGAKPEVKVEDKAAFVTKTG